MAKIKLGQSNDKSTAKKYQKPLLWRLRQLCRFWQPILTTGAAIVSLVVTLFKIL